MRTKKRTDERRLTRRGDSTREGRGPSAVETSCNDRTFKLDIRLISEYGFYLWFLPGSVTGPTPSLSLV
jgi:hypothetical protein